MVVDVTEAPPNVPPIAHSIAAPAVIAPNDKERYELHTTRDGNDFR